MSFDRVARSYRLLETIVFGQSLQRARIHYLNQIPSRKRALIVGEGNGRFLCELLQTHPKIDVDCVDSSARMLELARARIHRDHFESLSQLRFIHADFLKWSPSDSYDLIVTHFFLDCFQPDVISAIVDRLSRTATFDANWLLADFAIPPSGTLSRLHAKFWLRAMYFFFRGVARITASELVDPSPFLKARGFSPVSQQSWRAGMLKSELWRRTEQITNREMAPGS